MKLRLISYEIPKFKILFAGRGILQEKLQKYVQKIGIDQYVEFLGFRDDIHEIIAMSDIGISSSRLEGLGLNLIEAMFCGVPVVASVNRGHKEMIENGVNGFLFEQNNHAQFAGQVIQLYQDRRLRKMFASNALKSVQRFALENPFKSMIEIYKNYLP